MPGWRLGFAHGPAAMIREMIKLQQYSFVCAPQPCQWAGAAAMDVDMGEQIAAYRRKRDMDRRRAGRRLRVGASRRGLLRLPAASLGQRDGVSSLAASKASTLSHSRQRLQRPRHAFSFILRRFRRDACPRHRGPAKAGAGAVKKAVPNHKCQNADSPRRHGGHGEKEDWRRKECKMKIAKCKMQNAKWRATSRRGPHPFRFSVPPW